MGKFTKYIINHQQNHEKMFKTEMFLHLMTLNPPNLVEIEQKQNTLQIFIYNPLIYQKIHE